MQTLEMLSKFKSKLFSARGVFGGGGEEDKATPTSKGNDGGVGVAESHDPQPTPSTKEDTMKWYVGRTFVHNISYQLH